MDTFYTVPKMFYKLFTIFVTINNLIFPPAFILLPRKTGGLSKY